MQMKFASHLKDLGDTGEALADALDVLIIDAELLTKVKEAQPGVLKRTTLQNAHQNGRRHHEH